MNPRPHLKKMFRARQFICGAWTALSDPSVADLFSAILQPDFIGVDMEHSTLTLEAARNIFIAVHNQNCTALPRVSSHDPVQIRRLLDAGADGIIVPNVNSLAELEKIVKAMKYPPIGERGYGISRAQNYGENLKDYYSEWNDSALLIIIIESAAGVKNIADLVSHEAVDGILIGEYDLSGSLHLAGKTDAPEVQTAKQAITECCHHYQKSCGTLLSEVTPEKLAAAKTQSDFVVLSTDILVLSEWAQRVKHLIAKA